MTATLADLLQAATRQMQGPLTQQQEQELMTLKLVRWEGKALANRYESDVRAGRTPRL